MSRVQVVEITVTVARSIFANIVGKATRVDIDFPKVALLEAPSHEAA